MTVRDRAAIVRRATPEDVDRLVLLERSGFPDPWPADALTREIATPTSLVLAAAPGWAAPAVAYALYRAVADEAELLRLAVLPEVRRQGHARTLLAEGRRQLAGYGCHTCFLEVRADNLPAIDLYESTGFHRIGRRPHYYGPGGDALLYACSLRPPGRPEPAAARDPRPHEGG
jgi:ribosomal-protein-alanine N-acetyltransferase